MKFKSDEQRKAAFFNMFSKRGKSNLEMFTDDMGRLRVSSDTTADTSFLLSTDMDPSDTKKFIGELDEEALAGLKRVSVVRPKVMKDYGVEPGYYSGKEDRVPFGRLDVPKIVATAERRGRGGSSFVPGVAKDIGRAAFQNMYNTAYAADEKGFAVASELPSDLLEEEYLMQVYDDYMPNRDILDRMAPIRQDLEDEVWRLRAVQRLGHPSTLEARAWRMGKQPRVGVETFVDIPRRKYEKSGKYVNGGFEEIVEDTDKNLTMDDMINDIYNVSVQKSGKSLADSLIDLQKEGVSERRRIIEKSGDKLTKNIEDMYEPTNAGEIRDDSWIKDSDVGYKTIADLALSGKAEVISRLNDETLEGLLDYTTGHFNPGYRVVRERILSEKDRREGVGYEV